MTIVVKERDPLVVPLNIRRPAGIKPGDRLEFKGACGIITIVSQPQIADEETPEQRRVIDAQLARRQPESTELLGVGAQSLHILAFNYHQVLARVFVGAERDCRKSLL